MHGVKTSDIKGSGNLTSYGAVACERQSEIFRCLATPQRSVLSEPVKLRRQSYRNSAILGCNLFFSQITDAKTAKALVCRPRKEKPPIFQASTNLAETCVFGWHGSAFWMRRLIAHE